MPGVHAELADARVATLVHWSPGRPYRSSLDGATRADLAHACQQDTGESWLRPLGPAHALVETAHHTLSTADDPTDRAAVARATAVTTFSTIAGTLDGKQGPTPNIALLRLSGGQWHSSPKGPRLAIVTNTDTPEAPSPANSCRRDGRAPSLPAPAVQELTSARRGTRAGGPLVKTQDHRSTRATP